MSRKDSENSWSSFFVWAALGGTICVVCSGMVIPGCPNFPPRDQRIVEILEATMLSQATAAFHLRYGHLPPGSCNEVQSHFDEMSRSTKISQDQVELVASLDDAERIVFWLGGETNQAFADLNRVVFMDFDVSHFVDHDEDGFYEYASRRKRAYEYGPTTTRVSCDFSDDEMVAVINPN